MTSATKITLPVGVARYPALVYPDKKFHTPGIYKANVAVPAEEAEGIITKLQAIAKEHLGKALPKSKNSMWEFEVDDEGNETNTVLFKCSIKNHERKNGELWDRKPVQYDSQNNIVSYNVWGGTEMRVACEVYVWEWSGKKGISLQPYAVQILNLVQGGDSAESPFGAEEGGFVGDPGSSFPANLDVPDDIEEVDDF